MRPSGHERVAVLDGQREQRLLDRPQVPPRHCTDIAHDQGEPGVGDVLDGRPDVHVLAGGLGKYLLERADQTQHRVRGPSGLHGHEIEVEQIGTRMLGDQRGRLGWDHAEARLGSRQRGEDVQPSLQPGALLEDRRQLRGAPKVAVLLGVAQAGAHVGSHSRASVASASAISASDAPQGTTTVRSASTSLCVSSRQHLAKVGPPLPGRFRGQMSTWGARSP